MVSLVMVLEVWGKQAKLQGASVWNLASGAAALSWRCNVCGELGYKSVCWVSGFQIGKGGTTAAFLLALPGFANISCVC